MLFENEEANASVLEIRTGRSMHRKQSRYSGLMQIDYSTSQGIHRKKVWLKFGTNLERVFEFHRYAYKGMQPFKSLIVRPYFFYDGPLHETQFIAMEYVDGKQLKNIFWRSLLSRQSGALVPTFEEIGRCMWAFHNMSPEFPGETVGEAIASAQHGVQTCNVLDDATKGDITAHLTAAGKLMDRASHLPAVYCHNDLSTQNIMYRPNGRFTLVDMGGMRKPPISRWYDVINFLYNLETRVKYAPIVDSAELASLSRAFLDGYCRDDPLLNLASSELSRLLYVMKVKFTFCEPRMTLVRRAFRGRMAWRYRRQLYAALRKGQFSALSS